MKKTVITVSVIIYVIIITVLSLINLSDTNTPQTMEHFDKIVHFGFYFIMNLLLMILLYIFKKGYRLRYMIVATIISILYGISIEIVQSYVGRDFDVNDIIANSLGALVALLIYWRYKNKINSCVMLFLSK